MPRRKQTNAKNQAADDAPTATTTTAKTKTAKTTKTSLIVSTKEEIWNVDTLDHICMLKDLDPKTYLQLKAIRENIIKGKLLTEYRYKINSNREWGRLSARYGYQNLPRKWRHIMTYEKYYDIDIENCFFTILSQICHQHGIECPFLLKYNSNRNNILKRGDRSKIKDAFIIVGNGGNVKSPIDDEEFCAFFDNFKQEVLKIREHLWNNQVAFSEERRCAIEEVANGESDDDIIFVRDGDGDGDDDDDGDGGDDGGDNDDGGASDSDIKIFNLRHLSDQDINSTEKEKRKFFSLLLQRREAEICKEMDAFFTRHGWKVAVLVFDGVMIERKHLLPNVPLKLLRKCEATILHKTKFHVTLTEKSLQPTPEDWEAYYGPKDITLMKNVERLQYLLVVEGKRINCVRMGEYLMTPHPKIKGVYQQSGKAEDFINDTLKDNAVFQQKNFVPDLKGWFTQCDHRDFPLIDLHKCDRHIIAFLNGYLDINKLLFFGVEEYEEKHQRLPVTFHYFEVEFSEEMMKTPTPNWDKLINYQWDEDVCNFFEVCVGRLFYHVGFKDNYQFMPLLKGDANTGKSTLIDAITLMFPTSLVDVISANLEKTFGLQDMNHKALVVIPDIPKKLSAYLPQSTFQSMISGDFVSMPRKNKTALKEKWGPPLIAAGNYLPDYTDKSGSISRRYVIFPFLKFIRDRDSRLFEKIKKEIPIIAVRCLTRYINFVEEDGDQGIWDLVPEALKELQQDVRMETNELFNFLVNGDSYYDIVFEEGSSVSLGKFKRAYKHHVEFHTDKKFNWTSDYFPFKSLGYLVKEENICKNCGKAARASPKCCPQYHSRNRKKIAVIHNMRIKDKSGSTLSCPIADEE